MKSPFLLDSTLVLVSLCSLVACGAESTEQPIHLDIPDVVRPANNGTIPTVSGALFLAGGSYNFVGDVTPGTAAATNSEVVDLDAEMPPAQGTASFDITVASINYAATGAQTLSAVVPDDNGTEYLLISAFYFDESAATPQGTVVHVVVPASEAQPGATVVFDGDDRFALFAHGDPNQMEPEVWGAAAVGSVTFQSASTQVGGVNSIAVTGDFGEIQWVDGGDIGGGTLTPGAYNLTFVPTGDVFCDGDLEGQEASFQLTLAELGWTNGAVHLGVSSPTNADLTGPAISASFGLSTLALEAMPDAPPGTVVAILAGGATGPLETESLGTYIWLDVDQATTTAVFGNAGVGYGNLEGTGECTVIYAFQLTAP